MTSDKVKLIVTLNKGQYENLKNIQCGSIGARMIVNAVMNGIPLEENKGEWIPISERLPEAYQKVLVTYEEIHWGNEPTTYGVKLISFGGVVDFIAWQPLPEPYKGGE